MTTSAAGHVATTAGRTAVGTPVDSPVDRPVEVAGPDVRTPASPAHRSVERPAHQR
ncbi:hypothetical protein [Streptomyces sp. NPDC059466]|uniref:hypothetical protein n=1 Tax=unclassified Streptomyces TaxID=2593676 RepID=UPI0036BB13E5